MTDTELDLDRIEQAARDSLRFGGDRQVAQNCLDLLAEVKRLRTWLGREITAIIACPQCDYEMEVDPAETFMAPDRPLTRCANCGRDLSVRVEENVAAFGLAASDGPEQFDRPLDLGDSALDDSASFELVLDPRPLAAFPEKAL